MSTKTTLKRIALVAVSALGFGGLAVVVAPAASAATISSITVGTIPTARVGETAVIPITVNLSAAGATTESTVIAAKISNAPSTVGGQTATSELGATDSDTNAASNPRLFFTANGSGVLSGTASYDAATKGTDEAGNDSLLGTFVSGTTTAGNLAAGGTSNGVAATAIVKDHTTASSVTAYLVIRPDVAGTYSILVSATNGTAATNPSYSYEAGVGLATTVTISTGGGPTSVTLTNVTGTAAYAGDYGALIRVNLNGQLAGDEVINVTTTAGYIAGATATGGVFTSTAPTASTTAALSKTSFVNGVGFVNWKPTAAAQSATLTATATGTLSSITTTLSVAGAAAAADLTLTKFAGRGGTAVTTGWSMSTAAAAPSSPKIKTTATSSSIEWTFADPEADAYGCMLVDDNGGRISGTGTTATNNELFMNKSFTAGDGDTYAVVSLSHSALAATYDYELDDCVGTTITEFTVSSEPSSSASGSVTVTPSTARVATGGSIAITALVKDQFNTAMAGESVTTSVAGRNGARTSEVQTTSSTGYVTSTITDAGTTTSSATDTVTFTVSTGGKTGTSSLTWGAYTVGTVTVTGGSTTADADYYDGYTLTSIGDRASGPHGNAKAFVALVKDADGNVLSGVPVTFAVSTGLIQKTASTDYTTVYTNSLGKATSYVINWTEGKQTVTATAGGKSGTDYLTWDQNDASTARSVSGAAVGNKVTATVKDRYGNTVKGVTVTAKTSAGYFGSGSNSTTGTTDSDGNVSFFVTGANGSSTVTLSLDKATYVQSYDSAGNVAGTAATAAVAGTTVGTGASLSAAGVNSVDVAVTATDAAATAAEAATDAALEAIDAANAATDAANLAAEAADAATVAAEEARDAADAATAAVEALAAEVATLIAGLKAQITTLANTVAKIAKKVKA